MSTNRINKIISVLPIVNGVVVVIIILGTYGGGL